MQAPAPPAPAPAAIEQAADILARAERPLIIAGRGPSTERGYAALADIALRFAIPVAHFWPSRLALATDHPMHVGFDVGPWLEDADAVVVIDAMVPWIPKSHALPDGCRVIQIGPDPLFAGLPMRSFPASLAIAADVPSTLDALGTALAGARRRSGQGHGAPARAGHPAQCRSAGGAARGDRGGPRHADGPGLDQPLHRSRQGRGCRAVQRAGLRSGRHDVRAAGLLLQPFAGRRPRLGAAGGARRQARLARSPGDRGGRRRLLHVRQSGRLPSGRRGAAPAGAHAWCSTTASGTRCARRRAQSIRTVSRRAATACRWPRSSPRRAYEKIVEASDGYGERVETADALPDALQRALHAVRKEKRQALLNVVCS